jgi:hypothetical protein
MAALKFKLSNQHTRQVSNLKPFLPPSGNIKMDLKNNLRASYNKQNFKKLCNEQGKKNTKMKQS